jgi:hypothetical protein
VEGTIANILETYVFIDAGAYRKIFAHRKDFVRPIPLTNRLVGQRVSFELEDTDKGWRARTVTLLEEGL